MKVIPFEKLSKKAQKDLLRKHRKPPIPPSRKSDSPVEERKKRERKEKQKGYI